VQGWTQNYFLPMRVFEPQFARYFLPGAFAAAIPFFGCVVKTESPCSDQPNPLHYCAEKLGEPSFCTNNTCPGVARTDHLCVAEAQLASLGIASNHACIESFGDSSTGTTTDTGTDSLSASTNSDDSSATLATTGVGSDSSSTDSTWSSNSQDSTASMSTSSSECTTDADCAAHPSATICDPMTLSCVECAGLGSTHGCDPLGHKVCNDANTCVSCLDDSQCSAPEGVCLVDSVDSRNNRCVQCNEDAQCPVSTPICDEHVCRSCNVVDGDMLAECKSPLGSPAFCVSRSPGDIDGMPKPGECLANAVYYIGLSSTCNDNAAGTSPKAPLCSLSAALRRLEDPAVGGRGTIVVAAQAKLRENVVLDAGNIAIIADPSDVHDDPTRRPNVFGLDGELAALEVGGTAFAQLYGIDFSQGTGDGVRCEGSAGGASLLLRGSLVSKNFGAALTVAGNCHMHGEGLELVGNVDSKKDDEWKGGGSVVVDDSSVRLVNAIVAGNTTNGEKAGLVVNGTASLDLNYVTIGVFPPSSNALIYARPFDVESSAGKLTIRNSVIAGNLDEFDSESCPDLSCSFETSATSFKKLAESPNSAGVVYFPEMHSGFDARWRGKLNSPIDADLARVARVESDDPELDIDLKIRPVSPTLRTYPGASVP
jgi:hypothetical protein